MIFGHLEDSSPKEKNYHLHQQAKPLLAYPSALNGVGNVHVVNVPPADNQVVGVHERHNAAERHMDLMALGIAANADRRGLHENGSPTSREPFKSI